MPQLPDHLRTHLHHKQLSDFTGAIASLASGVSVLFGLVAAHFAPTGFGHVAVLMHLHRQPLIVRLSSIVAGVALAIATIAGLLRFYSWWRERTARVRDVPIVDA